jgi:hypothetical protein
MKNFKEGDKVSFNRQTKDAKVVYKRLNVGTIIKGPFKIDGINHYQIKWDNITPNQYPGSTEIELISPMDSIKYGWSLIE